MKYMKLKLFVFISNFSFKNKPYSVENNYPKNRASEVISGGHIICAQTLLKYLHPKHYCHCGRSHNFWLNFRPNFNEIAINFPFVNELYRSKKRWSFKLWPIGHNLWRTDIRLKKFPIEILVKEQLVRQDSNRPFGGKNWSQNTSQNELRRIKFDLNSFPTEFLTDDSIVKKSAIRLWMNDNVFVTNIFWPTSVRS